MSSIRSLLRRLIPAVLLLVLVSCDDDILAPLVLSSVTIAAPSTAIQVGQTVTAAATGFDQDGGSITISGVIWSTSAASVASVDSTGLVTGLGAGTARILATADGRTGALTITVNAPAALVINEVESNGGTPGDWVELYNPTAAAVDISGWRFKDNDDSRTFAVAAGTTIAAGGYYVLEEAAFGFGLGAPDAARVYSPFGVLVASHTWDTHATTTYARCPNATGTFTTATTSTKAAANDCSTPVLVKINEVESNGGTPGDWIELYNPGVQAVNLAGYIIRDNNDANNYALPANSNIAAGGYLVIEEAAFGFGLGQPDMARLFQPNGTTIVDSYSWDTHATTTYGRCPNGSGSFVTTTSSTKGAANSCPGSSIQPWPGSDDVTTVDGTSVFQTNLSGLTYEGASGAEPAVLWAVRNGPGTLYRLIFSGGIWTPDPTGGWAAGKALRYTDGTGNTDAEGVTFASGGSATGMYVATERNNDASTVSRNSLLRFDLIGTGTSLTATNDWNLTADLPVVGANLGIEAVTWVPDTYLTANGFFDESKGRAYAPADYASHGTGLFFVGVEGNGNIYVYALNHANNTFTRVAVISTGFTGVMGLEFDRELNYLWAICDDTCGNRFDVMEVDTRPGLATSGRFVISRIFDRPSTLPATMNNEGFAIAPQSECSGGLKPVFWSDDGETGGHSIRRARIPCARF